MIGFVFGFGDGFLKTGKLVWAAPTKINSDMPMIPAGFSKLAEKVRGGVVNIQVVKKVETSGYPLFPGSPFGDGRPFGDFFGPYGGNLPERRQQGVGSGFVISGEGFIVTNNHVVENATQIKVKIVCLLYTSPSPRDRG